MNGNIELLNKFLEEKSILQEVIFALPHHLVAYSSHMNKTIKLSAQDCSVYSGSGAYTGEISADMLKESGVSYVIIGHSERRTLFNENSDTIRKKIINALKAGLRVIFCVSEDYEQQMTDLDEIDTKNVIIAYEPISAIGTGKVPSIKEIELLTSLIREKYKTSVLYGGSVNSSNIKEILKIDSVFGVLVGGASLKLEEVLKMTQALT